MSQMNKEFQGENKFTELDRREFLKYMGIFSSMSFLANCSRPADKIIPYTKEISEFSFKNYENYTTVISHEGFAQGLIVKSFQGRPIKLEGNPKHPYSLGATTPAAQAALYDLYQPARLKGLKWKGKEEKITKLKDLLSQEMRTWEKGHGVWFLFPAQHSPLMKNMIANVQKNLPESKWLSLSPWKKTEALDFSLKDKDVVLTLDEDIFYERPDFLKLSREFMNRRKKAIEENNEKNLNTLISFSSSPQLVTGKADKKFIMKREEIWNFAVDLYDYLSTGHSQDKLAKDIGEKLKASRSAVFISHSLHPDASDLEKEIQHLLKSDTLERKFPLPENVNVSEFERALKSGEVRTLVMIETNVLYQYPEWKELIQRIPHSISYSLWETETTKVSRTQVASSHFLEYWSDLEAIDGTVSIQQPLIRPIFHSVSLPTFLSLLKGEVKDSYDLVRDLYEKNWEQHLKDGVISGEKVPGVALSSSKKSYTKISVPSGFTMKVVPDYSMGFGDNFLNPILQELPKAFSRIVWTNAYLLNAEDAAELRVKKGDIIEISTPFSKTKGPVAIVPYVAPKTIVASLGYGEQNRGANNNVFRSGEGVSVKKTLFHKKLASAEEDLSVDNRSPIQTDKLPLKPNLEHKVVSLYSENPTKFQEEGPQWGMTIDLTTCIGCQSCVVACQVENNVPFVGEVEASRGRMLHWLRIDTYQINESTFFQPVPCMHCEKAPCEVVCPVNATLHGNGGLNEMVYNRCVGTRYCSNNCPYRVRRFNFKAYSSLKHPYNMGFNPDVSVRDRGVMEKCTYCIQRIREGEVNGETSKVVSACAQVCPTEAIKFGDLRDKNLKVTQEKKSFRNYDLLEEQGTRPRTSYLKVIRNEHA